MQRSCCVGRNKPVTVHNILIAHHLTHMQSHEHHVPQIAVSHRIPGITDIIVPEGNIDAFRQQFFYAGNASPFRIRKKVYGT